MIDPNEPVTAPYMITNEEFRDMVDMSRAINEFSGKFPDHWTSLAVTPEKQQLLAEVILAGAIALRGAQ